MARVRERPSKAGYICVTSLEEVPALNKRREHPAASLLLGLSESLSNISIFDKTTQERG